MEHPGFLIIYLDVSNARKNTSCVKFQVNLLQEECTGLYTSFTYIIQLVHTFYNQDQIIESQIILYCLIHRLIPFSVFVF